MISALFWDITQRQHDTLCNNPEERISHEVVAFQSNNPGTTTSTSTKASVQISSSSSFRFVYIIMIPHFCHHTCIPPYDTGKRLLTSPTQPAPFSCSLSPSASLTNSLFHCVVIMSRTWVTDFVFFS